MQNKVFPAGEPQQMLAAGAIGRRAAGSEVERIVQIQPAGFVWANSFLQVP